MSPKKDQGAPAVPITASEKRRAAKLELEKFAIAGRLLIAPDGWKKEDMLFPIMENLARKAGAENPGTWDESGQAFVFPDGTDLQAVMQAVGVTVHSLGGPDQEQAADAGADDQDGLFSNQELDQLQQQDLTAEGAALPLDPQLLPLDCVELDPNQPRKTFSIQNLQELGETMKTVGQLQAILVRPVNMLGSPIRFRVVYGERRYRALQVVGAKTIRADIRHLTDEQVMEIQLVENMHREDVHPMQEATFFQSYMAQVDGRSVADIAERIARPVRYVANRMRLNQLTAYWQNMYLKGALTLEHALALSGASPEIQDAYAKWDPVKNYVSQWDGVGPIRLPDPKQFFSGKVRELERAPFDIGDPTLNPERGACTTCPFNTAVGQLFLEDGEKASCTLPSCWNVKDTNNFIRQVQEATAQDMVFLQDNYLNDEAKVWRDIAIGAGAVGILEEYRNFRVTNGFPEKPDSWEEYYENMQELPEVGELAYFDPPEGSDEDTDDEERPTTQADIDQELARIREEYEEELTKYNKELQAWQARGDKPQLGLWITGRNRGQVVPVTVEQKEQKAFGSGAPDPSQVDAPAAVKVQIMQMTMKADRSDELDYKRLWTEASDLATGSWVDGKRVEPVFAQILATDPALAPVELGAICVMLANSVIDFWDRAAGKQIFQYLDVTVPKSTTATSLEKLIFPAIAQKADQQLLNFLLRIYLIKKLPTQGSHMRGDTQPAAFEFIRHHAPTQVTELELKYDGKMKKRRNSLEARIEAAKRQAEKTAAGPAPDPADAETPEPAE